MAKINKYYNHTLRTEIKKRGTQEYCAAWCTQHGNEKLSRGRVNRLVAGERAQDWEKKILAKYTKQTQAKLFGVA